MFSILLVDDDCESRNKLYDDLLRKGAIGSITAVESAAMAENVLRDTVPDIILLDVVMPTVDGLELLKRIRFEKRFDRTIIVMMSSIMLDHVMTQAIEYHADYCLWKPLNADVLFECINMLIALRKCKEKCPDEVSREDVLRQRIRDQLDNIGIPKGSLGHEFLQEAIRIAFETDYIFKLRLSQDIYSVIAATHGVNASCVERNIRLAIKAAWDKNSARMSQMLYLNRKPKNGEFIAKIANIMRYFP